MRREVYDDLLSALNQPFGTCVNIKLIHKRFPEVKLDTLISIYSQEKQYKVLRSNHLHKGRIQEYCDRYLSGEDLLLLCASVDFPPCMMLRRMLESMLMVSKQAISDVLKDPHSLPRAVRVEVPQQLLQRLCADIPRCVQADACYSPLSDIAKQAAGIEHELLLAERLSALDIPFWTEGDLRARGYFKTPDVWLQVPIAVRDPADPGGRTWRLVSWIDSKATFGDDRIHARQMEEQYSTYVNRYGPGLVIYWFGHVDGLDGLPGGGCSGGSVLVLDDFPAAADVARMPRLEATTV